MATYQFSLRTEAGTATVPGPTGPVTVPFWGFRDVAVPGKPTQLPGPTLEAEVGGQAIVTLENALSEPASIAFPGQELVPQPVKDSSGKFISYTNPAPAGGSVTYTFQAARAGSFLYESGTSPERQVQMGLYGVLIVRPSDFDAGDPARRTAYGPGTEFDIEKVLVLGDIDTAMHAAIAAGEPFDLLQYAPDYWMINGRSYPHTLAPDDGSSQPYGASITAQVGQRVLLRCLNAGFEPHSLCFGGLTARVVGADGSPLITPSLDASYQKTAVTIGAGQTFDVIIRPEAAGEYYIFDRALNHVVGAGAFPGGMMTRLIVT